MSRKLVSLLLALCLVLSLAAAAAAEDNWKIGLVVSPISWGEEAYRITERLVAKYGEEHFIVNSFPEDQDVNTLISVCQSMAFDPDCKAIVFNQAYTGAIAASKAAREVNPDILIIGGNFVEEPAEISQVMDIALQKSFDTFGYYIADAAKERGCDTLVSMICSSQMGESSGYKRHMAMERRCQEIGIRFVATILPAEGPENRSAIAEAAREDVINRIAEFGANTAFYVSNSGSYLPIISSIMAENAGYYMVPSDPSPFVAYLTAFEMTVPEDHILDPVWTNTALSEKVTELGFAGHFGNWSWSLTSGISKAGVQYCVDYITGVIDAKNDVDHFMKLFIQNNFVTEADVLCEPYVDSNGQTFDNVLMLTGAIGFYGDTIQ